VDDDITVVRSALSAGGSVDDAAQQLIEQGTSPIAAIKALRTGASLSLPDAKTVVHRNLDPAAREAAEQLWQEMLSAVRSVMTQDGSLP
jgi:ribosomal protein L7/L12